MENKNIMLPLSFELTKDNIILNPKNHIVRKISSMKGHYKDEKAFNELVSKGDLMHYEIFENSMPEEYGHLISGISKLYPGKVGNEYFMTKGHYHTIENTSEIYLCLDGEGYMLMKTRDGNVNCQKMIKNTIVYVPPFWAHRSVNTGASPLVTFFIYNAEAGHNYGDIEKEGFIKRIVEKDEKVVIE